MFRLSVWALLGLSCASLLAAEDGVRLRATHPKPFYRPGDRIELEVRCLGAVTEDPIVVYNPTLERDFTGAMVPDLPKCPSSQFEIEVPADFIGKNSATAMARLGKAHFSDVFNFEVRTTAKLANLQLSTDGPTEGCRLEMFRDGASQSDLDLFAVMQDGARLDLCWEGTAIVTMEPAGAGIFKNEKGRCALTPRKSEPFKIAATYRGLRKEWPCTVDKPDEGQPPRPTVVPFAQGAHPQRNKRLDCASRHHQTEHSEVYKCL